jgi:hypothetical protein
MNIISFDIGTKNFAYTVITSENELNFNLINLVGRINIVDSLVIGRCQVLTDIVKEAVSLVTQCQLRIVIEKQVRANKIAINLMYSLITIVLNYTSDILLFVPNQKFILLQQSYTALKKAHKTLAIQLTRDLLAKNYPDKLAEFNKLKKKDDIADSFLMAYLSSLESNEDDENQENSENKH